MNVMVDIESLGPHGHVILSIAAVRFDLEGVGSTWFRSLDIWGQLLAGLKINADTQLWWREQSAEAQDAAQPWNGRVKWTDALSDLSKFIKHEDKVWAKGPDYDLVSLTELYARAMKQPPWAFRNTRDVRTILGISGVEQIKNPNKHSALDDAKCQAEAVILAFKVLGRELEA